MKRILLVGGIAAAAALTHSPWLAVAFILSLLGVFVHGVFMVSD